MLSSRLTWNLAPNRLSTALEAKRAAGIPVLDLTESNPTRAGLCYPESDILAALAQPSVLTYEPDARGLLAARQAVASYYGARGVRVEPDAIYLTASTSEAYAYLFKLLANPGDEALVPQPSYPLLDFLAALESVQLTRYPLEYDEKHGWRINLEALASIITTRTTAIVVINPNNPTGSFLKKNELAMLNELSAEYQLALIADEVFSDYGHGEDSERVHSLIGNRDALTFVLSGLSKISGLPQVKLAWTHISGPAGLRAQAQDRLDVIADTYLSVGTPVQHATARLLSSRQMMQQQIMQRITENDSYLRQQCSPACAFRVLIREGGWYAVLQTAAGFSEEQWTVTLLQEDDVLVHPGYFFDFPREGSLVLSLLTPTATFQQGVSRIIERLAKD